MMKKALSLALALVMCLGLTAPAFAEEDEGKTVKLRDGLSLTNVISEETAPGFPEDIPFYKVKSAALFVVTGCGETDETGTTRRASISLEAYEAVQNGPEQPADWDFQEKGPYIPGIWEGGEMISQRKWTGNGQYVFDPAVVPYIIDKPVMLSISDEWESVGDDEGNGLPSSGVTTVIIQIVSEPIVLAFQVSDWARERVILAVETSLVPEGLGDDYRVNITRAQFAAAAVKLYEAMSGQKAPEAGENPFNDTSDAVIIQASELGFVSGVGGGRFSPDALVTREQAALMLSNVYAKLGGSIPAVDATTFADNASISAWARNAVAFMNGKGIVTGVGGNNFGPQGNASIEQALLISLKMFEVLK